VLINNYKNQLKNILKNNIRTITLQDYDLLVEVKKEKIPFILFFLKNNTYSQFKVLTDIVVSDYPNKKKRFSVVYSLLSIKYSTRVNIKTWVSELDFLDSTVSIFNSANWMEREIWDMYGIFFKEHPDLRRILTDYGFTGHPLRKDFPLSGFVEVRYDDNINKIVTEPVELTQAYREFNFKNPWA
jgi:NADH/F420H2 dehydrogenase subunit C